MPRHKLAEPERPMGGPRARFKGEHFERMALGIAKFECRHPPEDGGRICGPSVEIAVQLGRACKFA